MNHFKRYCRSCQCCRSVSSSARTVRGTAQIRMQHNVGGRGSPWAPVPGTKVRFFSRFGDGTLLRSLSIREGEWKIKKNIVVRLPLREGQIPTYKQHSKKVKGIKRYSRCPQLLPKKPFSTSLCHRPECLNQKKYTKKQFSRNPLSRRLAKGQGVCEKKSRGWGPQLLDGSPTPTSHSPGGMVPCWGGGAHPLAKGPALCSCRAGLITWGLTGLPGKVSEKEPSMTGQLLVL